MNVVIDKRSQSKEAKVCRLKDGKAIVKVWRVKERD